MSTFIRNANLGDLNGIKNLYLDITEKYPDNLTPFTHEVTDAFVYEGLQAALERGVAQIMVDDVGDVVAYFKGFTSKNIRKAHILDNATMIVRTDYMNSVTAYRFFSGLFKSWSNKMDYIRYVRTVPHANNERVMRMSNAVGMKQIGTTPNAIMCKDGSFADDVTLIWENPNFSVASLFAYQKYLSHRYSQNEVSEFGQIAKTDLFVNVSLRDSINIDTIAV
jgi:hypothetical protein